MSAIKILLEAEAAASVASLRSKALKLLKTAGLEAYSQKSIGSNPFSDVGYATIAVETDDRDAVVAALKPIADPDSVTISKPGMFLTSTGKQYIVHVELKGSKKAKFAGGSVYD